MSAQGPQGPQPTDSDGMTRRELFRRGGTAAAGAAMLGTAGGSIAPQFSPVGRAQAIPPMVKGGVKGVMSPAAAAAGIARAVWRDPDTDDPNLDEQLETQLYNAGVSVADGREQLVSQMEHEFLSPEDPQDTPFGRAAWQEIRATVARGATNGDSQSAVEVEAIDAIDRQAVRSVTNLVESWNTGIKALVPHLTVDEQESVGVFNHTGRSLKAIENPSVYTDADLWEKMGVEPVMASQVSEGASEDEGVFMVMKHEITVETGMPLGADDLDGRDEPLEQYVLGTYNNNNTGDDQFELFGPLNGQFGWIDADVNSSSGEIQATHTDLETKTVLDVGLFTNVISAIDSANTGIKADLSEFVGNLYGALDQGAIDPKDILSAQDIMDEFAGSNEQSRLAAELTAIGAQVPESASYRAIISHPDLAADELECVFVPQFVDGETTSLAPGMTLKSSQYRMAYIGYESEANGEWRTETLSGESDLQVHDIEGVTGESQDISLPDDTAGVNGRVNLPEGIDYPESGTIVIEDGTGNEHTVGVDDVQEADDGTQYVELSGLQEGDEVAGGETKSGMNYERSVDYVSDPTTVDSEQMVDRMENLREQIDGLRDALDDDGGGGFSWPDLGGDSQQTWGALAVGGIIVVFLVGLATDMFDSLLGN